ncbi:hypothetical protein PVAP13_2KG444005 [Panicum virgatum]|uniref:Uncharacterized protein n=1 Tax=Panicum virgatum TaxID=38727 RepID=A0A8T0WCF3_PANVG|nr:hypothetical protein PVAP13_2KG444005 [Panicum virgatum]
MPTPVCRLHTSGLNFSPQKPAQETSDPGVKCTTIRCVCRFPVTVVNRIETLSVVDLMLINTYRVAALPFSLNHSNV